MAQRVVLEAQPFGYYDGMEQDMLDELNNKGYAVDKLEISGNEVVLDLTPGVYTALLPVAIAAMVAVLAGVFGMVFVSWRVTSIIQAVTPIVLIAAIMIGGVSIAYLMRPPPGGEYMFRGLGYGLATAPEAVTGLARGAAKFGTQVGKVAAPIAAAGLPLVFA